MSGFKCQTCSATDSSSEIVLRVRGWRIWSGTTLGGAESSVVFCPACLGVAGVNDDGEPTGWDAHCNTCDESMSDDWTEGVPAAGWTEKDAEQWQDRHECEPYVDLIAPSRPTVRV